VLTSINGVNLNIEIAGQGPPVLLLHGFTGDVRSWDLFREQAVSKFTVVAVDMLGHGASDAPLDPQRYNMDRCMRDLVTILNILEIEKVHWLGYSMGARIALSAAATLPDRTLSLISESGSPGLLTTTERESRIQQDGELAHWIEAKGVAKFVDYWESVPLFATQYLLSEREKLKLRRQRMGNHPIGLANSLRGMGTGAQRAMYPYLQSIHLNALFIAGSEDRKFSDIARDMTKKVRCSQLEIIPGVGHAPHIEDPSTFNRIVLDFLGTCESLGGPS